jgi:hypothetical protein
MKKTITNYTFTASAKTIAFNDYTSIDIKRIIKIKNLANNKVLFTNETAGCGTVSTNVLTTIKDTTTIVDRI